MSGRNLLIYCEDLSKLSQLIAQAKNLQHQAGLAKTILFLANPDAEKKAQELTASGVDQIVAMDIAEEDRFPETVGAAFAEMAQKYAADAIVMLNDPFELELAARITAKLDASVVTNCLRVSVGPEGTLTAEKMLYGGVVTGSFAVKQLPAVFTLNENACREKYNAGGAAEVVRESFTAKSVKKKVVSSRPIEKTVDLKGAERIVSIGRGLSKQEDLPLIEELATVLNAQMGCSRPLVEDYKWLKLERQVGLTGTTVAPKLYMAIGISGQIQHVVGMKDAQVIVAINNNRNAPIFDVADYGIVGDLYEIVPLLKEAAMSAQAG